MSFKHLLIIHCPFKCYETSGPFPENNLLSSIFGKNAVIQCPIYIPWLVLRLIPVGVETLQRIIIWRTLYRSRPKVFFKKGVLKNFAKFTRKHLCQSIFFNKVAGAFFFFTEHLRWLLLIVTLSGSSWNVNSIYRLHLKYWLRTLYKLVYLSIFVKEYNCLKNVSRTLVNSMVIKIEQNIHLLVGSWHSKTT